MLPTTLTLTLVAATSAAFGQSAEAPLPSFDVGSVKASPSGAGGERRLRQNIQVSPGTVTMHSASLKSCIAWAWHVFVPGKNGPKVLESKTEGETSIEPNQRQMSVTIQRAPVSQLVEMLSNVLRAPVVDQTGLKGRYDLTVNIAKYAADMAAQGKSLDGAPADPLTLISMVLQEELGLKLESKKMPLELVIVDHAEKVPVEN
jgi:hypothetical protein